MFICLYSGMANADCSDSEGLQCPTGNVGWQGKCNKPDYPLHPVNCEPCGPKHCPPSSHKHVEKQVNPMCLEKILKSGRVDGCSVPSLPGIEQYKHVFKASCDEHDICYHDKDTKKEECDKDFHLNMLHTCEGFLTGKTTAFTDAGIALTACRRMADAWYKGVAMSGATPWGKGFKADRDWAKEHCK